MKALSIRQPWAHLILHGGKDIENRDWRTSVRGRVLVHASKGMTRDEYEDAYDTAMVCNPSILFPTFEALQRGGIMGSIEIVDCVNQSESPWFFGDWGFVLREPKILPFTPWRGQLGFFDVPEDALPRIVAQATA